jgi:NAD+ diphosphatase
MINEIAPHKLYNSFRQTKPKPESRIMFFQDEELYCHQPELDFPRYEEVKDLVGRMIYLLALDDTEFFLAELKEGAKLQLPDFSFLPFMVFGRTEPRHMGFAAVTAYHLYSWYKDNRFCSRCGHPLEIGETDRSLGCPACGFLTYPRINPCVIVGITNGDKILMSKTILRPFHYSLTAGFTEIGETFEETVHREAMEEAGLKVKNLRFYKCQPWAASASLLMGYFAEVDGSDEINIGEDELVDAKWVRADEITFPKDGFSLTSEMLHYFKDQHTKNKA